MEEIERTGGYVVQFVGDEVMAMWGAPAPDEAHALRAVETAIRTSARLTRMHADSVESGTTAFWIKIGVNTGKVVVGNVGSENRYNYTAVGEMVNIASRLEAARFNFLRELRIIALAPNNADYGPRSPSPNRLNRP